MTSEPFAISFLPSVLCANSGASAPASYRMVGLSDLVARPIRSASRLSARSAVLVDGERSDGDFGNVRKGFGEIRNAV